MKAPLSRSTGRRRYGRARRPASSISGDARVALHAVFSPESVGAAPQEQGAPMATITPREAEQVERANASQKPPVVFIHGLWLLPSSWDRWAQLFEEAGYAPVTPSWPDDPETIEAARANPDVLARKTLKQIAGHTADVIAKLARKPAVMGHSTGGLLAQIICGRGLSAATVAIDPGPFRGASRCLSR